MFSLGNFIIPLVPCKTVLNEFSGPSFTVLANILISDQNIKNPLLWRTRVEIGLGTARGLCHLHTALKKPLVHRDVKSANILLDANITPKVHFL